jgi:hypothetical protein
VREKGREEERQPNRERQDRDAKGVEYSVVYTLR